MGEIAKDMQSPRQMARLLQGDVGSGKTVVAAFALFLAAKNGAQGALMAPTEILARQHYQNLTRYLFPLGIRVELLLGSMTAKEKEAAMARLLSGEAQVAVGTHALIQEGWASGTWASPWWTRSTASGSCSAGPSSSWPRRRRTSSSCPPPPSPAPWP